MRIDLKCAECASNNFTLDEAITDSSLIRCADCGHQIGTLGQLKDQVAAEVLSHSSPGPASNLHPPSGNQDDAVEDDGPDGA